MRTCASLDGKNAGRIDQARTPYPLRVFLRDDVVGDDADLQIARLHHRDQALDQRRLAGAPTGPPMPMRATPGNFARAIVI